MGQWPYRRAREAAPRLLSSPTHTPSPAGTTPVHSGLSGLVPLCLLLLNPSLGRSGTLGSGEPHHPHANSPSSLRAPRPAPPITECSHGSSLWTCSTNPPCSIDACPQASQCQHRKSLMQNARSKSRQNHQVHRCTPTISGSVRDQCLVFCLALPTHLMLYSRFCACRFSASVGVDSAMTQRGYIMSENCGKILEEIWPPRCSPPHSKL